MTTTPAPNDLDFDPACSCRRCGKCDRALGELAATRKAKAENDERFMLERDAAREELAKVRAELDEQRAVLDRVAKFADDMATWCSPYGMSVQYAERLRDVLANPATTAEPADEPKANVPQYMVPTCPACGEEFTPEHPGSNERCPGCRYFNRPRRSDATPAQVRP